VIIDGTLIEDSFAEAFDMKYARLIITAEDDYWLDVALRELVGYGSSVIGCDLELGVERPLPPEEVPDGRPGASVLGFGFSRDALAKAVCSRVGQCVMTCPTTAVYDGMPHADDKFPLGSQLRFFGDGFQKSKQIAGRRYWRIPVMDGEFVVEETAGIGRGIAGGNIILQSIAGKTALNAAKNAALAVRDLAGVITPFPGGVVRSGSKVGSRYKALRASTNDAYCPTLRGSVESRLLPTSQAAYELVFDGVDRTSVEAAMRTAIRAASGEGVVTISAGNYGGQLGKHHIHLRQLFESAC
jgi:formylmethanofuran--tetrahydromethanopterin N-formyltransferase